MQATAVAQPAAERSALFCLTTPGGLQLPAFGEIWPGNGGRLVAIVRGPAGQPMQAIVKAAGDDGETHGAYGPISKVAGAMSLIDGLANTKAMAEAGSEIAKKALAYNEDGHGDYYIMAADEAHGAMAGAPHLFSKDWYWTSTQNRDWADYAVVQDFDSGYQDFDRKSISYGVAFVRRVPIL